MCAIVLWSVLSITQVAGDRPAEVRHDALEAVFERASKQPDLDGAGLVLSSLLSDDRTFHSALLKSMPNDERSVYVLFGGNWGSRAAVNSKDVRRLHQVVVDSVSTTPSLIRQVIRADRYETFLRSRRSSGGAATMNYFPFFSYSTYADDLVESFIETLRKDTSRPAKPVVSLDKFVLVTADEMEVNLLSLWQMLCGACDRMDLIDKATTKTWRGRFPELDKWFNENRPYILWDNSNYCIRIDQDQKELGRSTPRTSRSIPELKPPWMSATR
jgi:hypothetical protein